MSLATLMADPTIPDDVKRSAFSRAWAKLTPGEKREYYYERYVAHPAHAAVQQTVENLLHPIQSFRDPLRQKPLPTNDWANTVANVAVPSDIEGAAAMAAGMALGGPIGGKILGKVGGPLLAKFASGPVGYELGGTLGGMAQGKSARESALDVVPGAASWALAPYFTKKLLNAGSGTFDTSVSQKATKAISSGAKKMFRTVLQKYPELEDAWPTTPHDLVNYFAEGASPVTQKAGEGLGDLRRIIAGQPAFYQPGTAVQVPVTTIDPVTKMPIRNWKFMSIKDAMDYNQFLYGRGYMPSGAPRAAMGAIPDRGNAAIVRERVLRALNKVPRVGPQVARDYENLSHDYGMAKTFEQIFTKDAVQPNGLLNHENIYSKAANPKNLAHIANLEGESILDQQWDPAALRYVPKNPGLGASKAQEFIDTIAPGRERIAPGDVPHARVGALGVHFNVVPHTVDAPQAFQPAFQQLSGPAGAALTTRFIEGDQQ